MPWTNGSTLLPTVKSTDTAKPYYCHVCQKAKSHSHPFGMTCGHCQPINSIEKLPSTLYQAASHARTLALREMEKAWKESEAVFSSRSLDSQIHFDQDSSSWKTCQRSLFGGEFESLMNLPQSGMTVGGQWYQPPNLEPPILDRDSFYWPTPTAHDARMGKNFNLETSHDSLSRTIKKTHGPGLLNPVFVEWLMGYPLGWTELKDWAIQWFQSKPGKPLKD